MSEVNSVEEQMANLSTRMGFIADRAVVLAEENQQLKNFFTTSMCALNRMVQEREKTEADFARLAQQRPGRSLRAFNAAFFVFCALLFCLLLALVVRMKTSLWVPEYF